MDQWDSDILSVMEDRGCDWKKVDLKRRDIKEAKELNWLKSASARFSKILLLIVN
jgi:hypothetical protein